MAELVVALDVPGRGTALTLAEALAGPVTWVKVGLELYTAEGPEVVARLRDLGLNVFLDLKFLDIPNTVLGAVRAATTMGVSMLDVHAMGGERMMRAALEGRELGTAPGAEPPLLLGITVLTSMDPADMPWEPGPQGLPGAVLDLAQKARHAGLDGVVCSGREAAAVKQRCGEGFVCLTPGIRPESAAGDADDQRRVMTAAKAVAAGADFLVVGRPVTRAANPRAAAEALLQEMARAPRP
jgi:orotidine-5'-phosphate decarboxylase